MSMMKRDLLENPGKAPSFYCKVEDGKVINLLTGRELHYGDLVDHFICKFWLDKQGASAARLHGKADTAYPHEHPIPWHGDNPEEQWAAPMVNMFTSVLNHLNENEEIWPALSRDFCVENEEDWQKYVKEHGKDAQQGWWCKLEPAAQTKKKRARASAKSTRTNAGSTTAGKSRGVGRKTTATQSRARTIWIVILSSRCP